MIRIKTVTVIIIICQVFDSLNSYAIINSLALHLCPVHDVLRYPSGVRLYNRKVLRAFGHKTKYSESERFFFRSINYNLCNELKLIFNLFFS